MLVKYSNVRFGGKKYDYNLSALNIDQVLLNYNKNKEEIFNLMNIIFTDLGKTGIVYYEIGNIEVIVTGYEQRAYSLIQIPESPSKIHYSVKFIW